MQLVICLQNRQLQLIVKVFFTKSFSFLQSFFNTLLYKQAKLTKMSYYLATSSKFEFVFIQVKCQLSISLNVIVGSIDNPVDCAATTIARVFVFDMQHCSQDARLLIHGFFQSMLQSETIVKVFHDCRLDVSIIVLRYKFLSLTFVQIDSCDLSRNQA